MASRSTGRVILAALGGLLLACDGSRRQVPMITTAELPRRFAVSSTSSETAVLDFATPAARDHLVAGWRGTAKSRPFVTSKGARSTVRFFVHQPRDLTLRLRCRPRRNGPVAERLTLLLNGKLLEPSLPLRAKRKTYTLEVPAAMVAAGDNSLQFHLDAISGSESSDAFLAIDLFALEVDGARPAREQPFADAARDVLFIPYGARVDFPVLLAPGSELAAERLDFRGGIEPRLEISQITDLSSRPVSLFEAPRSPVTLDLAGVDVDTVLLSFHAASEGTWGDGDGVYLQAPTIRAPALRPSGLRQRDAGDQPRPSILVYLVDTLRADHLSTYGYDRPTSPHLDEFAATSILFEKPIGQSSWTRPSVASLFSGQWPAALSIIRRRDALSEDVETLAELLQRAGYTTAGFSANPNVSKAFGFAQGFDLFKLMPEASDSAAMNLDLFSWLEARPPDQPFFLYVQTADPHTPYLPPEPFRSRLAPGAEEIYRQIEQTPSREIWETDPETIRQLLALYDAEIAANDQSFGALLARLTELRLLDDMLVIFLSDHGEEFHEHGGWTHGRTLHAETLDFPLVIKLPGQRKAKRIGEVVQHVDILPTIVDLVGLERPEDLEGRSLLSLMAEGSGGTRPLSGQASYAHVGLVRGITTSIVVGEWKLIDRRSRKDSETRLYRWTRDGKELDDLAARFPIRVEAMRALLTEKLANTQARAAEEASLDPELEQRLRALGYL